MTHRLICRFLCCIVAFSLLAAVLPASGYAVGRTIYFDNTDQWGDVYIYYWSAENTAMTRWPGERMQKEEGTIYSFILPAGVTMVIFNNANGTQTADLTLPEEDNLYTYDSGWSFSDLGCDHVWDDGVISTAPSCTDSGVRSYACTLCGETAKTPISPLGHTMKNGMCTVCGATGITVYYENINNWGTVRIYYWSDADTSMTQWPGESMTLVDESIYTFVLPGMAQYVIFNNGSNQTGDLTLPGSDWIYTADGWKAYATCDHSWDAGTVTPASCTVAGNTAYLCTLCGESRNEPIPAAGHRFADGKCIACGALESCSEHVWDEGTVIQDATCWVAGTIGYTCTLCGAETTQSITPGHKLYVAETIEPTCTATGQEVTRCTGCAYVYRKTLPRVDHTYVPGRVVAPTCGADGYTVGTCSGCEATTHMDRVDRLGHDWKGIVCTRCGLECHHQEENGICVYCHKGGPNYEGGYYLIENAAQLYWFASQVNGGEYQINGKMIADIDLGGRRWTSIGYYCSGTLEPDTMAYSGIFDGQGHTVSNFVSAGTDNEGLFGYCSSATIMNVGVTGATVTGWRAGAIAGYPLTSTVSNCFAIDCTIIGKTSNSVAQLSGDVYIAPIASPQGGIVKDCYALNCTLIDQTDLTVNAAPVGGTDTQNGYYYGIVYDGSFYSTRNSIEVTADQLASGEVTYLLNHGVTDGTQGWYQTCGVGLPAHNGLTVYAEQDCQGTVSGYTNSPSTEHNYENGFCTICGEKDPEHVIIPNLNLNYPSLSFEDEILYNVYFTLDEATSIVEMGLVTFAEKLADGTIADAVDVISGYFSNDAVYMVQSNGIPAKKLGDTLYFKVYVKLTDGSYVYSDVAGYNAVAYAKTVLGSAASSKDAKALMVAMLNYGTAAQEYFGYKTDAPMNSFLTDAGKALVKAYDESMVADVVKPDADKVGIFNMNGGYDNIYPTVSFEGAFSINFYLTPNQPVDDGLTLYYWDAETYASVDVLTPENATGVLTAAQDGSNWGAAVEGIAAKAIDETIYVAGLYTSNGVEYPTNVIAYSLGSYCKTIAANGETFGAATAVYGFYAKNYFADIA